MFPLSDEQTRLLAMCVLGLLCLALVVATFRVYQNLRVAPMQLPIYMFNQFMSRVIWRAEVDGHVRLPAGQGAVIVCNHRSPIDPGFIALACDRQVHWMVAREYCSHPLVGWALKTLQVIPTGRGGVDTAATKLAMRYAQQGELVGMFPEGRLNETSNLMLPGRPGAALVALKARVPVVPCYITGSPYEGSVFGFLFMTAKARLRVGEPIDISEYYGREGQREVLDEMTKRFMREIALLAGVPNYEPVLAGKHWKATVPMENALEAAAN